MKDDIIWQFCKKAPKVELHRHLEGSLRPELLLRMASRNSIRLPFSTPSDFYSKLKYRNFQDFIPHFLLGVECFRTIQDFYEAVIDLGEQLSEDNICHAEVTFTPQFYRRLNISFEELLEILNFGRIEVEKKYDISIRWIPDLVRNRPQPAYEMVGSLLKLDWESMGVVALGLGGPEKGFSAQVFKPLFDMAAKAGLPANPHAGETDGATSVADVLLNFDVRRIGHGIRVIEDLQLLSKVISQKIALEVCLSSNLELRVVTELQEHPIKKLWNTGCILTLNSDDPVLFKTNLCKEYYIACKELNFSIDELSQIAMNALEFSYLSKLNKNQLRNEFKREYNCLKEGQIEE